MRFVRSSSKKSAARRWVDGHLGASSPRTPLSALFTLFAASSIIAGGYERASIMFFVRMARVLALTHLSANMLCRRDTDVRCLDATGFLQAA